MHTYMYKNTHIQRKINKIKHAYINACKQHKR